ncbi:MAG TPA: uracil-DNA glycosylase [Gemmatimonadales bacterium]|nr:uracil-DNA glycosylase [Gemmatimonadales bacterium]
MHPDLARYLRQQVELGGEEAYIEKEPMASKRMEFPLQTQAPTVVEAVIRETGPAADVAMPKWRKDAPPIPGPGLQIIPPAPSLLGDGVSGLESLAAVATMISGCTRCVLCQTRTNTVPGEGNPTARLMCIGEGPGATEDEKGRPFVGAAGQLLDQILAAIECPRESVFIANIVKCRPPQNRKPLPDEATNCLPYLHRQIALVRPKVLIALGSTAAEWLLNTKQSLGNLRGKVHRYGDIPLVVTYHPAALLRNPNWKKPTWDDVRIARQLLDQG